MDERFERMAKDIEAGYGSGLLKPSADVFLGSEEDGSACGCGLTAAFLGCGCFIPKPCEQTVHDVQAWANKMEQFAQEQYGLGPAEVNEFVNGFDQRKARSRRPSPAYQFGERMRKKLVEPLQPQQC